LLAEKIQADRSAPQEALERRIAQGPGATRRRRKPAKAGRPDPVGVATEFLRKRLGKGPVLVSELEATARAAGLLGNGQRITHAKPFKKAKKSLGIRSVRNGFGSAGEVTRMHLRYDANSFPEDVVLMETGDRSNFQGRYALHYPWPEEPRCVAGDKYLASLPARFRHEAENLAGLTGWSQAEIETRME
jgi:hypothetical protein